MKQRMEEAILKPNYETIGITNSLI